MNADEFVQEVMASNLKPNNFEEKYREFQIYQKIALNTLQALHDVCVKSGIQYQLAFGSLLGAIRDGGQIPWDYDIDVFIEASDRTRLIDALRNNLDKDYYFYCPEQNTECTHAIIRLAPNGFNSRYLHVDVFILMGISDEEMESEKEKKEIADIVLAYKAKKYNPFTYGHVSRKELELYIKTKIKMIGRSTTKLWNAYTDLIYKHNFDSVQKCCCADKFSDNVYPTQMMRNSELFHMEIGSFYIPRDYDDMLQLTFGDYNKLFPLEARLKEMMGSYNSLKRYCPLKHVK